ncbi:hypothetical protein M0811_10521 [Anaeramoeba ignava]|uniref:Uncharacterized protein n=1 Tax=Anaeramoeba ignava TaxID=1746090 RepID=A0A9Q0RA16_ANAIG|nr:hypothetical protein M0811_10521 [Anaeramoeba ignava]
MKILVVKDVPKNEKIGESIILIDGPSILFLGIEQKFTQFSLNTKPTLIQKNTFVDQDYELIWNEKEIVDKKKQEIVKKIHFIDFEYHLSKMGIQLIVLIFNRKNKKKRILSAIIDKAHFRNGKKQVSFEKFPDSFSSSIVCFRPHIHQIGNRLYFIISTKNNAILIFNSEWIILKCFDAKFIAKSIKIYNQLPEIPIVFVYNRQNILIFNLVDFSILNSISIPENEGQIEDLFIGNFKNGSVVVALQKNRKVELKFLDEEKWNFCGNQFPNDNEKEKSSNQTTEESLMKFYFGLMGIVQSTKAKVSEMRKMLMEKEKFLEYCQSGQKREKDLITFIGHNKIKEMENQDLDIENDIDIDIDINKQILVVGKHHQIMEDYLIVQVLVENVMQNDIKFVSVFPVFSKGVWKCKSNQFLVVEKYEKVELLSRTKIIPEILKYQVDLEVKIFVKFTFENEEKRKSTKCIRVDQYTMRFEDLLYGTILKNSKNSDIQKRMNETSLENKILSSNTISYSTQLSISSLKGNFIDFNEEQFMKLVSHSILLGLQGNLKRSLFQEFSKNF